MGDGAGRIRWPDGKDFAFTVFDDTDRATVENVKPVYDFLGDLGFRTTKSVWPLRAGGTAGADDDGSTCEDPEYLEWVLGLQARGFEIGLHGVASRSSPRGETVRGVARFRELFGPEPVTYATHMGNAEGMYFGPARLSGVQRVLYSLYAARHYKGRIRGHVEGDEYFWGDVCREHVKYVRNFVFPDINTLKACPVMPYHDPRRPHVNYWYAASNGMLVDQFVATTAEANQDRLAAEGGACVMYTHFACGFLPGGELEPRFERQMRRLAGMNGWFVPVRTLLDFLIRTRGHHELTAVERNRLEMRWLMHKARVGRG